MPRSAPPEPSADGAPVRRDLDRGLFAFGLLVPLLAGGNVLLMLEPTDALPYLDLVAVGAWCLLARRAAQRGDLAERPPALATACLIVLGAGWIAQLALRPSGPRAFLEAQGLFAGILLFAGLACCSLRRGEILALLGGLFAGSLVTVAYGQYQYWVMFPRLMPLLVAAHLPAIDYVNANFYNANCYASFLAALVLLGVGALGEHASRAGRAFVVFALLAFAGTLLLSESRSTIGLLLIALAVLIGSRADPISMLRRHRRFAAWVLVGGLVALAASLAVVDVRELWRVGWLGRIAIWRGSFAIIRDHWLVGIGIGRFWDYFPTYRTNDYYTRYPHNFLLEIVAEQGVIAGAALIGFLASAFARPVQTLVSRVTAGGHGGSLPASIVLAAALLLTHALLDIDWHAPADAILLFVLLGVSQSLPARSGAG